MKPKFYYLHGFSSAPDRSSDKVKLLESIGEVILLGYDSFDTYDNIMKHLAGLIQADNHDYATIVGTSLGGFYAAELAKRFGYPCVMINPAWKPHDVLGPQCGQTFTNFKTGAVRTLDREATESYAGKGFDPDREYLPLILLDEADDLLDSKATFEHFTHMKCPVHLFEGGNHRFEHMKEALPRIQEYMHHCEHVTDMNT